MKEEFIVYVIGKGTHIQTTYLVYDSLEEAEKVSNDIIKREDIKDVWVIKRKVGDM